MSQEAQREKSLNQDKKKTRRTRKDEQGRNFTCPCGKSYLSYPALYTHIKTKHQGKTPKQDVYNFAAKAQQQQQQVQITKQPLIQIKQILDKYFPGDKNESYPTPISNEQKQYIQKIIQNWQQIKQAKLEDPYINPTEPINTIFSRFLYEMKAQITPEGFDFLCQFICCLKKIICDYNKDEQYCQINNGSGLPSYFNSLVLRKKYLDPKKGSPIGNSFLCAKITLNFGAWMYDQRYTNTIVKFTSF